MKQFLLQTIINSKNKCWVTPPYIIIIIITIIISLNASLSISAFYYILTSTFEEEGEEYLRRIYTLLIQYLYNI